LIAVDTTVWIDFFRSRDTIQTTMLCGLIGRGLILVGDIVLVEVLQGVRNDAEAARVERILRLHSVQPMLDPDIAPRVAANYRALRARGITVRKTIDMIIGTFCIERGHALLHSDRDFEPMQLHLGLQTI
jgi:predicted nucleic acid-binding protein